MAKVIVYIEGGIIQNVVMDEDVEVLVVDQDADEMHLDEDTDSVFTLNEDEVYAYRAPVDKETLIPWYVEKQFKDFSEQEKIKLVKKCFKV